MAKEELTFWRADDVGEVAEALIPDYHPHLLEMTVLYIFRSKAAQNKGKDVWGKARKLTGLNAYLAVRSELDPLEPASPSFFVVEIAHDVWNQLRAPERIALVDHELSHIAPDGSMQGHDVEEFKTIVARHGHWRKSLKEFAEAGKQVPLFEAVEALRPKKGSGIDSVTISTPGGKSTTLTAH